MIAKVELGAATHIEGQAAQLYWRALMGSDFRRNPAAGGANGLLNYGYAIVRSMVARHLMGAGAGLHPGVPIFHANGGNPMRLVDDMMEPFRPWMDLRVRQLIEQGCTEVDARAKQQLALLPSLTVPAGSRRSPITLVCERWCQSLAAVYLGERRNLVFPDPTSHLARAVVESGKRASLTGGTRDGPDPVRVPTHVADGDV